MSGDSPWGELIGMHIGTPLIVHKREVCAGNYCCIHNPSKHPLNQSPLNWRGHVMERVCSHGIGHPDPDDLAWRDRMGWDPPTVHGCDGCCHGNVPAPVKRVAGLNVTSAPWSPEQVDSLNRYQESGLMHPYTCPNRDDHCDAVLVATADGWICRPCGYTQDWAHPWSADGTWEQLGGGTRE